MGNKSSQLQIRVSPAQKEMLKRLADEADLSLSAYVLSKALPSVRRSFEEKVEEMAAARERPAGVKALLSFLAELPDDSFRDAVGGGLPPELPPVLANYATAAVEAESARRRQPPPEWARAVPPLPEPHFGFDLPSLRPHLMRITPPAFKRRRLFFADPHEARI